MGHPIHKHMGGMKSAERYDAKEAFNKNLDPKARLHYLENNIADKKGMSRQASPLNIDGGKAKHEKHIGKKLDDQTWGGHTQTEKHHRGPSRKGSPARMEGGRKDHKMSNSEYSAHLQSPKGKKEHGAGMSRYSEEKGMSMLGDLDKNGTMSSYEATRQNAIEENMGTSRKSSPANNVSYGDKSGKTGYIGEAKYDMKYNAVDDITQGKGKADYGMSRKASPLNNEGHGGKKGHGHATIVKKIAKKKPIVNKQTKERLPNKQK